MLSLLASLPENAHGGGVLQPSPESGLQAVYCHEVDGACCGIDLGRDSCLFMRGGILQNQVFSRLKKLAAPSGADGTREIEAQKRLSEPLKFSG